MGNAIVCNFLISVEVQIEAVHQNVIHEEVSKVNEDNILRIFNFPVLGLEVAEY
jgi:hypothetical protein